MSQRVPIFITARFRSGSTLLWNIFDHATGYRAYYEPCHDNLLAHIRYTPPMASHRGVENYWGAYQDRMDDVERLHRPQFGLHRLRLEAGEEWNDLQAYLSFLIDGAAPETAVLQFNRLDFRLPWLRA